LIDLFLITMADSSLTLINESSATLHPKNQSNSPSHAQTETHSPWFMQRPKSSGIDMAAFSFAKPASHRQAFALRKPPKCPPVISTPIANLLPLNLQRQPRDEPDEMSLIPTRLV
jgi:hypothetical protein